MKKGLKVALIIFAVLIAAVGAVAVWQWDNIKLFTYTDDDIKQSKVKSGEDLRQEIADYLGEDLRAFTDEELAKIEAGELSPSQAVADILAERKAAEAENAAQKKQAEEQLAREYTERLSALQSKYVGQLKSLVWNAETEYNTAVRAGEEKLSAKTRIIRSYASTALALESSCDGEFYAIIAELEADLKNIGSSLAIVDSLKSTYNSEKQAMKASYLSRANSN